MYKTLTIGKNITKLLSQMMTHNGLYMVNHLHAVFGKFWGLAQSVAGLILAYIL